MMNIYELLREENKHFWDSLKSDQAMFSEQDYAYWADEENNRLDTIEEELV